MAAVDRYAESYQGGIGAPHWSARDAIAVTPSDVNELTYITRGLYIGGAGDVVVVTMLGTSVTFKAVPVGTTLAIRVKQVKQTATTATNILALD